MKTMNFEQMEMLNGGNEGPSAAQIGCGLMGLATGIACGFNPIVGGLYTYGCLLTVR